MRVIGIRRNGDDAGAAAVEFAILLPLFLMLVFGMISGGFTFERWINVTQAARETSRFAATYPIAASTDPWFAQVSTVAAENAGIRLTGADATPAEDYYICIAFLNRVGPGTSPASERRTYGTLPTTAPSSPSCTGSTIPDNAVEVVIRRTSTFDWIFGGGTLAVTGDNTSRYEPRIAP